MLALHHPLAGLIEAGADEICIKDMAGIGRPVTLGKIVAGIKQIKDIPIQYHSHAGPGFNMASILAVCEAGCDYIDVGMEPLSWGTGHADLLGAVVVGYGSRRPAQRAGHAEGRRLSGARNQHGGLHEGARPHPGVHGRLPGAVHLAA